jgi:hypothetical protein
MFLGLLLLVAVLAAEGRAQQPANVRQLGYLIYGSPASVAHRTEALRMGLRDLGYVEGKTSPLHFDQLKRQIGCPKSQPSWSA